MPEYTVDAPDFLYPEYVRDWLNGHAAMGHRLITCYPTDKVVFFVFELPPTPFVNWLTGKHLTPMRWQDTPAQEAGAG